MDNHENDDPPDLAQTDWRQGSFLPAEAPINPTLWVHDVTQLEPKAIKAAKRQDSPFSFTRALKAGDRFCVVTQTCDVIKPADMLPQVEVARAFSTTNERMLTQARNVGSARYFVLGEAATSSEWWLLDYGWRTFIDKGFLVAYSPDNAIVAAYRPEDEALLSTWLGRRNGRPALPDLDVEQICDPVRHRFERLREDEPAAATRYSEEFVEFRYRREADETVTVFLLSSKENPDPVLALEVMEILSEAIGDVRIQLASDKISYATFTKADELSTAQIDMFWASYEEGEAIGALPAA